MTKRTVAKAARLVLLHLLREGGALPSEANQSDIAALLGVNRSTIHRDLRELDKALDLYQELVSQQLWLRRLYTTDQAAEALGLPERIVRDMAGAGVIRATKAASKGSPHQIAADEVQRWQEFLGRTP